MLSPRPAYFPVRSGMPACEASHYLQLWDSDAPLKPRGFDAATSMRLHGVADIAAVSTGASGQLGLAGCCPRGRGGGSCIAAGPAADHRSCPATDHRSCPTTLQGAAPTAAGSPTTKTTSWCSQPPPSMARPAAAAMRTLQLGAPGSRRPPPSACLMATAAWAARRPPLCARQVGGSWAAVVLSCLVG